MSLTSFVSVQLSKVFKFWLVPFGGRGSLLIALEQEREAITLKLLYPSLFFPSNEEACQVEENRFVLVKSSKVRFSILNALGNLGDSKAVEPIIKDLTSSEIILSGNFRKGL